MLMAVISFEKWISADGDPFKETRGLNPINFADVRAMLFLKPFCVYIVVANPRTKGTQLRVN